MSATKFYNGIDLQSQRGINFADPTSSTDAATKNYVDGLVNGLAWKQPVRAATTAAGTLASSFANGSVVDGVTLATNDRILIKNQAAGSENGIYVVAASGAPTRAADSNTAALVNAGTCYVTQGTTNADKAFTQTADSVTLGTTSLVYAQVGGGTSYTAGNGLQLATTTFSVLAADATINVAGGGISVAAVGTSGIPRKYAQDSPSLSANTPATITHSLGTTDVVVFCYLKSTGEQVDLNATVTSTSAITIVSVAAQSSAAFRIVVVG